MTISKNWDILFEYSYVMVARKTFFNFLDIYETDNPKLYLNEKILKIGSKYWRNWAKKQMLYLLQAL